MCDSIVATAPHTAHGQTLFGKNSDRNATECQPFLQFPHVGHAPDARLACTHLEIPQLAESHRVMGHSPWWIWGFEHGVNEHAVAIGNQAVFSREPIEETLGLIGMDLVRLGLERAATAREALAVITELLETHGQGGAGFAPDAAGYHNSFVIADPHEALLLETSNRKWVMKEVEMGSLSNHLCITDDWTTCSADLESFARHEGWWDGTGRLDVQAAYRNPHVPAQLSSGRLQRTRELLASSSGTLDRDGVVAILRDHGENQTFPPPDASVEDERFFTLCAHHDPPGATTASMLIELSKDRSRPSPAWISFGWPCLAIFLPVYLEGVIPAALARGAEAPSSDSAWWIFHDLQLAAARDLEKNLPVLRRGWVPLEERIKKERGAAEEAAAECIAKRDLDAAAQHLGHFMQAVVNAALESAQEMRDRLG